MELATKRADKEDEKGPPIIGSALCSHSIGLESGVRSFRCAFRPSGGETGWDSDPPGNVVFTSSCSMALHTEAHTSCWLPPGVVVQLVSHALLLFVTPWTTACQASLIFTISWSLLKLMSTELVMPSNHLILCHPLLLLPSIFPSIMVFSNELALCIRWQKY